MLGLFEDKNAKGRVSLLHCTQDHMVYPLCLYGVMADTVNSYPISVLPSLFVMDSPNFSS